MVRGAEGEASGAGGFKKNKMKGAVATNATVDLEDLDCTVCLGPLQPPVFQCAAGHVVCSICYEKLPAAKDKCQEHEKECPKAVCDRTGSNAMQPPAPLHQHQYQHQLLSTDCFTFVIPKQVSSSTSINISINNGEIKQNIHDNKISADPVVKMGPCGGGGGDAWKMDMRGVTRIFRVVVRHGEAVDAISALYERDGQAEESKLWGGTGGQRSEICLRQDEYLTSVKGHYGFFDKWFIIRSLTFVSNQRTFGPYGKQEGAPFKLPAAGGKIIGFHGRCSCGLLDALGTYVKMG